jgi:hypothetical protein
MTLYLTSQVWHNPIPSKLLLCCLLGPLSISVLAKKTRNLLLPRVIIFNYPFADLHITVICQYKHLSYPKIDDER